MFRLKSHNVVPGTPLEEIRFSSEELAALLGGFDRAHFCVSMAMGGPLKGIPEAMERGRAQIASHLARTGLVDDDCQPIGVLAEALLPLHGPGSYVADGNDHALALGERDMRTECVYLAEGGGATLVKKAAGPFGGWHIRPLEGERALLDALLQLNEVGKDFCSAGETSHLVAGTDPDAKWIYAVTHGGEDTVREAAALGGFDPTHLLKFSAQYRQRVERGKGRFLARKIRTFSNAGCDLAVRNGVKTELVEAGLLRGKLTYVYPEAGCSFSLENVPYPGDQSNWWETQEGLRSRQFGCFDFYESADDLARRLLIIDDNPDAPKEA